MNWSAGVRWTTLAKGCCVLALLQVCAGHAMAQPGLLGPADTAIAIDLDSTFVGPQNNGRYPGAESPAAGIDGLANTKYLNFGAAGSGFIVSPALPLAVDGFQITTANDAPGRDPAMWSLYGFNGALTTTDSGPSPAINQDGLAETWSLIASGSVALPGDPTMGGDQRGVVGPMVSVNSTDTFDNYKFIVDAIKRPSDNIMQFADIQFFFDETDPGSGFLAPTDPIIAVDEVPTPAGWKGCPGDGVNNTDCSSFPGAESPASGIDQVINEMGQASTKYLNFGEERSGIIVTNSEGPVQVNYMRLTTANDAVERDPTSYELYGTNDPITSEQNSNSNGTEVWTLISSGSLSLSDDRYTPSDFIAVNSPTAYSSYRMVFPTIKDPAVANSMQIADIQFYTTIPEPTTVTLVALGGLAMAMAARRRRT